MQAIIIQSFVAAPPGEVWAALFARADLVFDGLPADGWPGARDEQPPFHLKVAWSWTPAPTEVAVTLHQVGGGTRLDLRHSGWQEGARWEPVLQGHFAGWLQGLAALGLIIETGVDARPGDAALLGRERYLVSGEIPAEAAPVYRSLTDAEVLARWSEGVFDGLTRAQEVENRLVRWRAVEGGEVTTILRPTPRGTHLALAEYGVAGQHATARWPAMFEKLTRFLG